MNERIRELLKQAGLVGENGHYEYDFFDPQKFAESIVKECAGIELYWLNEQDRKAVAEKIRKHFGVRE